MWTATDTRLAKSLEDAVESESATRQRFEEIRETFAEGIVSKWDQMIADWEDDHEQPNPYVEPEERGTPVVHIPFAALALLIFTNRDHCQRMPTAAWTRGGIRGSKRRSASTRSHSE